MAADTVLSATTHEFMCCAMHTGPWASRKSQDPGKASWRRRHLI